MLVTGKLKCRKEKSKRHFCYYVQSIQETLQSTAHGVNNLSGKIEYNFGKDNDRTPIMLLATAENHWYM